MPVPDYGFLKRQKQLNIGCENIVVFNSLSACLFMNHNGMSHPKKNILNRWSVMQRAIQSSFKLYTECHVLPYTAAIMCTLYVTTTPSTCWQSGRSLAASLPYQYHKSDNGMICALNG